MVQPEQGRCPQQATAVAAHQRESARGFFRIPHSPASSPEHRRLEAWEPLPGHQGQWAARASPATLPVTQPPQTPLDTMCWPSHGGGATALVVNSQCVWVSKRTELCSVPSSSVAQKPQILPPSLLPLRAPPARPLACPSEPLAVLLCACPVQHAAAPP